MKGFPAKIFSLVFVAISACTSQSNKLTLPSNMSELVQDESKLPVLVYVRQNSPPLESYHSFMVDPITVFQVEDLDILITQNDVERLKEQFHQKVEIELIKAGLKIVDSPQQDTLKISIALSNLRAPISLSREMATALGKQFELGRVTITAAFSQASSDKVMAVVMDKSRGENILSGTSVSNFVDIEVALDSWAVKVSEVIGSAHRSASCPILKSEKWYAWLDKFSKGNGQYRLNINGEVIMPSPGFAMQWSVGPTDRMRPPNLRLNLLPKAPDLMAIQVLTTVPVKYYLENPISEFNSVSIFCGEKLLSRIEDVTLTD